MWYWKRFIWTWRLSFDFSVFGFCYSFTQMRIWPAPAPSGFVCGVTVAARGAFPGPEWSGFCPLCRKAPKTCCELRVGGQPLFMAQKTDTFAFDVKHFKLSTFMGVKTWITLLHHYHRIHTPKIYLYESQKK